MRIIVCLIFTLFVSFAQASYTAVVIADAQTEVQIEKNGAEVDEEVLTTIPASTIVLFGDKSFPKDYRFSFLLPFEEIPTPPPEA